jgi:hypothetical protein
MPRAFPIRNSPSPEDMQDAMPFLCPHLVILQALKPKLAFDPLTQLLVVVGQLLGIAAFCRGEGDPQHLEFVAFPEPQKGPDAVVAAFLFPGPLACDWFPPKLLPAAHRAHSP